MPSSRDPPNPGIKPAFLALQLDSLLLSHQGSPTWEWALALFFNPLQPPPKWGNTRVPDDKIQRQLTLGNKSQTCRGDHFFFLSFFFLILTNPGSKEDRKDTRLSSKSGVSDLLSAMGCLSNLEPLIRMFLSDFDTENAITEKINYTEADIKIFKKQICDNSNVCFLTHK